MNCDRNSQWPRTLIFIQNSDPWIRTVYICIYIFILLRLCRPIFWDRWAFIFRSYFPDFISFKQVVPYTIQIFLVRQQDIGINQSKIVVSVLVWARIHVKFVRFSQKSDTEIPALLTSCSYSCESHTLCAMLYFLVHINCPIWWLYWESGGISMKNLNLQFLFANYRI